MGEVASKPQTQCYCNQRTTTPKRPALMKIQALLTLLFLVGTPALAQSDTSVDLLRMKAAKNVILSIGLGSVEATETQIAYLRRMAKGVLESGGAFLFDMPEETARQSFETQIGYQAGALIAICSQTSVEGKEPVAANGMTEADLRSLCL